MMLRQFRVVRSANTITIFIQFTLWYNRVHYLRCALYNAKQLKIANAYFEIGSIVSGAGEGCYNKYMNSSSPYQRQGSVRQMSSQQLKILLEKLQQQHDILQAKNEDLGIQISDLRKAVKCVEDERKQSVDYQLSKKKELERNIDTLQRGIKSSTNNHIHKTMEKYKVLME